MDTTLGEKHSSISGVFYLLSRWCVSAIKGFAFMAGGMGGCVIIGTLLLPLFLIVSFLLKLILILQHL